MTDRERAIKGLECCIFSDEEGECTDECPYYDGCWEANSELGYILKKDALKLLKEQEPRVIPYGEIDKYEVLWLEVRDVRTEDGLAPWVKTQSGLWYSPLICGPSRPSMELVLDDGYEKIARCWTKRPTDKQRNAWPWKHPVEETPPKEG